MIHKSPLFLRSAAAIAFAAGFAPSPRAEDAEVFEPQTHGIERYGHIWKQSPFFVETEAVKTSEGLGQRFALTGIASLNNRTFAFLFDRGSSQRFMVANDKAVNGVELVSIARDPNPTRSTATIRVGSEQAAIQYDASVTAMMDPGVPNANPEAAAVNRVPPIVKHPNGVSPNNRASGRNDPAGNPPVVRRIIRRPPIVVPQRANGQ